MRKQMAFTLIEVLIAVIILSIALLAVLRNTSLATRETNYLQQRTIAHWVSMDVLAKARVGLVAVPPAGGSNNGKEAMLNQTLNWQIRTSTTPYSRIMKIEVFVTDPTTNNLLDNANTYLLLPAA